MSSSVKKRKKGNDNNYEVPADFSSCKTVKHGKKRLKNTITRYCQINHHSCSMINHQSIDHTKKYRNKYNEKLYLNDQLQRWGRQQTLTHIVGIDINDSNAFSFLLQVAEKKNEMIQKAFINDEKWYEKRKPWVNNIIKIYHEEYESEGTALYDTHSINQTTCLAITLFDVLVDKQCTCFNKQCTCDCLSYAELSQIALILAIKYETLEDEPRYDHVRKVNNLKKTGEKLACAELQCFAKLNYNVFYPTTMHFLNYFFGMGIFFSDDIIHYQNGDTVEANTIENLPPTRVNKKRRNFIRPVITQKELFNNFRKICLTLVHTTLLHYEFKKYQPVVNAISILIVARCKLKFFRCWRKELGKLSRCDNVKRCRKCYMKLFHILHNKEEVEKIVEAINL